MKKVFSFILFMVVIFIPPAIFGQVQASSFTFDPTTSSAANGATFQVAVIVNAGSDQIRSTDIYITYDATLLEAQSVANGTFFPTVTNNITSGRVYIAGMVDDGATTKTGTGTVATVTFKGLKEGTGTISFDCTNSLIVKADANGTNLLTCSANGSDAVTIGAGGGTNPTPTGTTGGQTTPSQLPRTGIFDHVVNWSQWGMVLVILGGAARLLLL